MAISHGRSRPVASRSTTSYWSSFRGAAYGVGVERAFLTAEVVFPRAGRAVTRWGLFQSVVVPSIKASTSSRASCNRSASVSNSLRSSSGSGNTGVRSASSPSQRGTGAPRSHSDVTASTNPSSKRASSQPSKMPSSGATNRSGSNAFSCSRLRERPWARCESAPKEKNHPAPRADPPGASRRETPVYPPSTLGDPADVLVDSEKARPPRSPGDGVPSSRREAP